MSLKNCDECGEKISEHAEACPRCGSPDPFGNIARNADFVPLSRNPNYQEPLFAISKRLWKFIGIGFLLGILLSIVFDLI